MQQHERPGPLKVVTNQSWVVFSLSKGEKWSVWLRVGSSFNHEHWGARGCTVSVPFFFLCSPPTPLTPTYPFIFLLSTRSIPSLSFLCLVPRSLLPQHPPNTHTPFNVTFSLRSNFLLSLTLPPSFHSTFSTSSSHDPGFYQASTYFNCCLHLSTLPSLHHPSPAPFPRSFNPFRSSLSWPHIHSSIPQLPALRTSAIVNLV